MRFSSVWLIALFGILAASSIIFNRDLSKRSLASFSARDAKITDLVKRKGGGGGGKGGSSGGSSSGGKTGGSSSGSTSSGASSGSRGGTSAGGSGAPRAYGGGGYYGGGAAVPYTAGSRTPKGLLPVGLLGVGALGFFGGAWLYGAYLYPYHTPYSFYNSTARLNQSKPVNCLCQQYSVCGCDDNNDPAYFNSVIGDGDPSKFNQSLVRVADVNGTSQIFINGTLPNGTTADGPSSAASGLFVSPATGAIAIAIAVASAMFSL